MSGRLSGKVAIVTGAGRNIGRAEALALAAEGASVLVNDRTAAAAEETVELVRKAGGQAAADAHSADSWANAEAIVAAAIEAFGRVDILVNNAGIIRPTPITEMSEEDWDAVVNVSHKGYAAMIRFAAPHMIAQGDGGVIANTGSTSGLGHPGMANYSAAKEGVLGLTRTVARDLGCYGIRCNLVRPINFMTGMGTPELKKTNEFAAEHGMPINGNRELITREPPMPEPVAALVTLLCLPCSAHVTSQDFLIAGDTVGRFPEPEMYRTEFHAPAWTLDALERHEVAYNLLGSVRNFLVRT